MKGAGAMLNLFDRNRTFVVSEREDLSNNFDPSKCEQYAAYIPKNRFFSSQKSRKVLVLIHGFNSTTSDAIKHYDQISKDLGSAYDNVIYYLWPGGKYGVDGLSFEELAKNLTVYSGARSRVVERLKLRLEAFLSNLRGQTATIDIIAHSMGCRLTLEALASLPLPAPGQTVRYVYLMGAAVGSHTLSLGGSYYYAAYQCKDIYIFFSKNDSVLKKDFPLGECTTPQETEKIIDKVVHERIQRARTFTGAIKNATSSFFDDWSAEMASAYFKKTALGFTGPEGKKNGNVIVKDVSKQVDDHSGYYTSQIVLSTIKNNATSDI